MTEHFICLLDITTTVAETATDVTKTIDGWEWFGRIADILGFISFGISLPTLFIAQSTKAAVETHVEKNEYAEKGEELIDNLEILYLLIIEDNYYEEKTLKSIVEILDKIKVNYKIVLKPYYKDIKKLKKLSDSAIPHLTKSPNYNRRKIEKQINIVITELKKGKRRIR